MKTREHVEGAQDWYFMAYGHDYKAALKDYTLCRPYASSSPLCFRLLVESLLDV